MARRSVRATGTYRREPYFRELSEMNEYLKECKPKDRPIFKDGLRRSFRVFSVGICFDHGWHLRFAVYPDGSRLGSKTSSWIDVTPEAWAQLYREIWEKMNHEH